jgi:hypothetical protein
MPERDFIDLALLEDEAFSLMRSLSNGFQALGFSLEQELSGLSVILDRDGWTIGLDSVGHDTVGTSRLVFRSKTGFKGTFGQALSGIRSDVARLRDVIYKAVESFDFKASEDGEIKLGLEFRPEEKFVDVYFSFELFKQFTGTKEIHLLFSYDSNRSDNMAVSFAVKDGAGGIYLPVSQKSFPTIKKITKQLPNWLEQCTTKHTSLGQSIKPSAQVEAPKSWRYFRDQDGELVRVEIPEVIYERKKLACLYVSWLEKHSSDQAWHDVIETQRKQGSFFWYQSDDDVIEIVPIEAAMKILRTHRPEESELMHVLELVSENIKQKKPRKKP